MILFVYGTLTFPEIVQALTGKHFRSEAAVLEGYSVRKLADWPYPGLVPSAGEVTHGLVLYDVDEASFQIIEAWEANGYQPEQVTVAVGDKPVEASTYRWLREVEPEIWDRGFFKERFLKDYVDRVIPGFKARLTAQP